MDEADWRSGGRFRNPWPQAPHRLRDVVRWKLGLGPREVAWGDAAALPPAAPRVALDPATVARPPATGWRVVWLGHSSFLVQGAGRSLWIDPVFSHHCAPLPLPSLRRLVDLPCRVEDLPRPDLVLVTHAHYDHLDLPSLRAAGRDTPVIVPQGHAAWLRRRGFAEAREIPWFGSWQVDAGLEIHAVPARHFTARLPWDRDRGHWCGWVVRGAGLTLWHAGDTGWCPAFAEIGERFGGIDFAMLPIGAYAPRWLMEPMHMNPEEAVRAFREARCRRAVAMHWGTFRLTDEPPGEPPARLAEATRAAGLDADTFRAAAIGEILTIEPA